MQRITRGDNTMLIRVVFCLAPRSCNSVAACMERVSAARLTILQQSAVPSRGSTSASKGPASGSKGPAAKGGAGAKPGAKPAARPAVNKDSQGNVQLTNV